MLHQYIECFPSFDHLKEGSNNIPLENTITESKNGDYTAEFNIRSTLHESAELRRTSGLPSSGIRPLQCTESRNRDSNTTVISEL